jgi:hypothetical protein
LGNSANIAHINPVKRTLGFGYALVTVLCFALCGCGGSRSNPTAYAQEFFDRVYGKGKIIVIDCGAFVKKTFDGKTYEVAKANVSGNFGADAENVMGLVVDPVNAMMYSMPLEDFDKFLADGDTSAFPKKVDLTVR